MLKGKRYSRRKIRKRLLRMLGEVFTAWRNAGWYGTQAEVERLKGRFDRINALIEQLTP